MSFRQWTECARAVQGNQPLWPWLLGAALDEEFQRQRSMVNGYQEEVFKDRDEHAFQEGTTERRMTAVLFHHCMNNADGCLTVGDEPIWLLGYEWPNQGGVAEMGRRADLVGLRRDGGLVVFECKRSDNADPPLTAVVEGLDYLACLLRKPNFDKILSGFEQWLAKPGKRVPNGFEGVRPNTDSRPSVIVLAPEVYFSGRYSRSKRGEGWPDIAVVGDDISQSFRIGFAASDFSSSQAPLV